MKVAKDLLLNDFENRIGSFFEVFLLPNLDCHYVKDHRFCVSYEHPPQKKMQRFAESPA